VENSPAISSAKPVKQSYDRSLQSFVLSATTLSLAATIVFFAVVAVLNIDIPNRIPLAYSVIPIALLGVIYNFFIWPRIEGKYPFGSTYISLSFAAVTLTLGVIFSGGLGSPYYPVLAILVVASCILGVKAAELSSAGLAVFVVAAIIIEVVTTKKLNLYPSELFYSLIAIIFGLLVARMIDHYVETQHLATTITNQLDSTQLSEKLMLAAIADPVIGVNKKLEVILFNSAAEDITDWDTKEAQNAPLSTVIQLLDSNDNAISKANNPFLKVFATGEQLTTDEFHILTKTNAKINFSISVAPTFDMQNDINGAIAVFHDISEQKALQRQRNEFVSTASHEMRTPVAAIEGYLSMAANPNLATVDDRARNFIEKGRNSALHLGKLFQDLLSVTKIEDQRLADQRQVFNMTDLVSQVASEMEIMAKKKGLSFYSHIGSERAGAELVVAPEFKVNADPDRVREIISNLVSNSIKYTQSGSVELILTGDSVNVKISVRDTGIGIPAEEQKHMFEKFYRVNNSMTREVGGTGLGLYIARTLVELYGGRIWVESAPGKGSTFSFTLPIVKS
jgi:signal transduction histidine kinase